MAIWGKGIGLWRSVNGKEVGFLGPRDCVPVPLFIESEAACLWFDLLAAQIEREEALGGAKAR